MLPSMPLLILNSQDGSLCSNQGTKEPQVKPDEDVAGNLPPNISSESNKQNVILEIPTEFVPGHEKECDELVLLANSSTPTSEKRKHPCQASTSTSTSSSCGVKKKKKADDNTCLDYVWSDETAEQYAAAYFMKVKSTLPEDSFSMFLSILNEVNENPQKCDVVNLFNRVTSLFQYNADLCHEFLGFLELHQALAVGKFQEALTLRKTWNFLRKFEGQHSRLMHSLLHQLDNTCVTPDSLAPMVSAVLKGQQHLASQFLQLFPSERPPTSSIEDYETIYLGDLDKYDDYEMVRVPVQHDKGCSSNCSCVCHTPDYKQLCVPCNLRFVNGKLYVVRGKMIRAVKLDVQGAARGHLYANLGIRSERPKEEHQVSRTRRNSTKGNSKTKIKTSIKTASKPKIDKAASNPSKNIGSESPKDESIPKSDEIQGCESDTGSIKSSQGETKETQDESEDPGESGEEQIGLEEDPLEDDHLENEDDHEEDDEEIDFKVSEGSSDGEFDKSGDSVTDVFADLGDEFLLYESNLFGAKGAEDSGSKDGWSGSIGSEGDICPRTGTTDEEEDDEVPDWIKKKLIVETDLTTSENKNTENSSPLEPRVKSPEDDDRGSVPDEQDSGGSQVLEDVDWDSCQEEEPDKLKDTDFEMVDIKDEIESEDEPVEADFEIVDIKDELTDDESDQDVSKEEIDSDSDMEEGEIVESDDDCPVSPSRDQAQWSREEDKLILETFQKELSTQVTFSRISSLMPGRSVKDIQDRFQQLMLLLEQVASGHKVLPKT